MPRWWSRWRSESGFRAAGWSSRNGNQGFGGDRGDSPRDRRGSAAFAVARAKLVPEMSEKELADELDHQIRHFGGAGCCFEPIIGVGPHGALPPHYRAGT